MTAARTVLCRTTIRVNKDDGCYGEGADEGASYITNEKRNWSVISCGINNPVRDAHFGMWQRQDTHDSHITGDAEERAKDSVIALDQQCPL